MSARATTQGASGFYQMSNVEESTEKKSLRHSGSHHHEHTIMVAIAFEKHVTTESNR